MARLRKRIAQAAIPVKHPPELEVPFHRDYTENPLPSADNIVEVMDVDMTSEEAQQTGRKSKEYELIEVTGSKGKKYKILVPKSYAANVPKVWRWDTRKLAAAELIAQGVPITQVATDPQVNLKSRLTIYAWLEHPEYKEHVDALVTETGYANQRERIAGMNRLTQMLFDKLEREIEGVRLTDKSVGAIISGVHAGMKHLAQEKGEFVEQQNIQQQTNLTGALAVAHADVADILKNVPDDERKTLEAEFDKMGDELIRSITGAKD